MHQVIAHLGGRPAPRPQTSRRKLELLDALEKGELTVEEALNQMKENGGD